MKAKKSLRDIARDIAEAMKPKCVVCTLPAEEKAQVQAMRFEDGKSYAVIAKTLLVGLNLKVSSDTVQKHFREHEQANG